ncbi:ABC transporter transmembrane domain-containing protein [Oryzibacter oryziterrae]|uniref:ABC transporter transmembrane domain-containing protein n=1 Tax=Oryzibacter oryziterrae TaxID=2766474 RepID=UPI001EFF575C|nr:ABC transporter transmembrane domain-containing protein [Oryzibacter oryziterrae]
MTDETAAKAPRRSSLKPLRSMLPFAARYKGRAFAALGALVAASAATLAVPIAVRGMIDNGFVAASGHSINQTFSVLMVVVSCLALASALRYYLVMTLGERVVADVRAAVFSHLTELSPAFFDTARSGEIVSRLTADTTQIKAAAGSSASIALRNLFLFFGAAVMMVVSSPWLSSIVLAAIPLIVLPLVAFGRTVRKRSREAQDTLADASAYAQEAIGAIRTVQAYTSEVLVTSRFTAEVNRAFDAARTQIRTRGLLTFVAIFLVFVSIISVLWIGARAVVAGDLSAGTLGQFVLYAVFAAGGLSELSQVWGELTAAAGAAERLAEILEIRPAVTAPANPQVLPPKALGEIRFEGVSFAYPSRPDMATLTDLSFAIRPGETVAIVGPSGAGKSTVFQLLLRFYDPAAGRILVDGVDVARADPRDVRRRMALVAQDPVIFAADVRDNIRFGAPGATNMAVEQAAAAAHADSFVNALPEGYSTQLGERGVTLSGGQRQRIAIARAILRDAPVLLLDEATSALDAESERLVQAALDTLAKGRTTLIIAHRLATVVGADRILVMDGGRIVEEGTHAELVEAGGLYARLARLQFEA